MASIDKKIVEMQLDNKNFESNAKTSLSTVEKMKKTMDFDKVGQSLSGVGKAASGIDMSSISSAAETVTNRLSTLGIIGVTALMNITNSAIDAGAQLLKSLTIEPITQGFAEYELKMGSIQTIMASTGAPLQAVNEKLEELNLYADKTIYSFSDMTSNIGKFTNAGVGLDQAVAAIQGVSNVAAVSGANSNEASRAMYNFAQALSAGHVKLIDWKSIENANMATVEFKTQLMESAVAAGTLEKRADGMYNVLSTNSKGGTMKQVISATSNFNESLEYQWMTTDALIGTLGNYADETTEIGKKAFAAAQDVKTFTQLIDTLQEAVGSGWGATFELLIGDFNEAKSLFTDLSDHFGGGIARAAEARNTMLKGWKDLGGRDKLLEGLWTSLYGIEMLIDPIKRAFRDLFPKQTSEGLFKLTEAFSDFAGKVFGFAEDMEGPIYNTFKGLFSVLKIVTSAVGILVKGFGGLLSALSPLLIGFLNITGAIGNFISTGSSVIDITNLITTAFDYLKAGIKVAATWISDAFVGIGDSVNKLTSFIKIDTAKMADGFETETKRMTFSMEPVTKVFQKLGTVVRNVYDTVKPILKALGNIISTVFGAVTTVFSNLFDGFTGTDLQNVLNVGVFTAVGLTIRKFLNTISGPMESFSKIADSLSGILDSVGKSFEAWQQNLKAKTLLKIASAIAILAGALWVISTIDSDKMLYSLGAVVGLFASLFGSLTAFTAITSKLDAGALKDINKVAMSMISLSVAVLVLATAVQKLSAIPWKSLVKGVGALVVIMGSLIATSRLLSKDANEIAKVSAALIIFGLAIAAIVKSVKSLGNMDTGSLIQGMVALTILIAELMLVSKALAGDKDMIIAAANLKALGASIVLLAASVKILASMDLPKLIQGVVSLTAVIAALTIMAKNLPKDMALRAAGLMTLAGAVAMLSLAVQILGRMPIGKLITGVTAIAGVISILVVAINMIEKDLTGVAGIIALAAAVNLLVIPLALIGSLPFGKIVKGLIGIAGVFAILGVAAALLTPIAPTLLTVAGAFALFGVSMAAIGVGVLALSTGLIALGTSAAVVGAGVVAIMGGLVLGLVTFMKGLGDIVNAFVESLADIVIGTSGTIIKMVGNIITILGSEGPKIIASLMQMMSTWFNAMQANMPRFLESGSKLIISFMDGMKANLPALIASGVSLMEAVLAGLVQGTPALVSGLSNIVISLVNTLTEQSPLFLTAVVDLIIAMAQTLVDNIFRIVETAVQIVATFATALGEQLPVIIDSAFKLIIDFINGLADAIRTNTGDLLDAGANLVSALVDGVIAGTDKMLHLVCDSAKKLLNKVVAAISGGFTWLKDNGWDVIKNVVNGVLKAVTDLASSLWGAGSDIVTEVIDAIGDGLTDLWDAGWDIAKQVVDGIIGGIGSLGKTIWNGAKKIGSNLLGGIKNVLDINSPSREAFRLMGFLGKGLLNGMVSIGTSVYQGASKLGGKVLDPITDAMTSMVDNLETDPDFRPVITPVLNTTDMDKGLKSIKGAMSKAFDTTIGNVSVLTGASRLKRDTTKSNGQNGSTKGQDNSVTTNNITLGGTYHIREESDIHKVAKELHNLTKKKARA